MILRDPVHGLVSFEADEYSIVPLLVDKREVQRLRRIRQLGLASLAYPGGDHTRFSHALGAAHVMTRFINRLREIHDVLPFWQRVTTERARDAVAAALLHDLGHGPFSHLFEDALPAGPTHERWTVRILNDPSTDVHRILTQSDSSLPGRVAELVEGKHPLPFLAGMVAGTFDVDRCDYLLRDAHATGVRYGSFDLDWLLRSLRLGPTDDADASPTLAIDGTKGLPAIESFILARRFMFQQVYFHKTSRASEWMLTRLLARVRTLLLDGTPLRDVPPAIASLAVDGDAELRDYLALDDVSLWTAIDAWRDCRDSLLSDLSGRLYDRRLFKTLELFGDQTEPERRADLLARARGVASEHGLDPEVYVGLDVAVDVPYDAGDSLQVIVADGPARPPHEVSFLLGRLHGERLQRYRLVFPPEIREPILAAVAQ
jgi:HD superfamily phosphohydrolase